MSSRKRDRSGRDRTGRYNIQITYPSDLERFEQLKHAVAEELGVEPSEVSRPVVVREAAEAYLGGDPCGAWWDR